MRMFLVLMVVLCGVSAHAEPRPFVSEVVSQGRSPSDHAVDEVSINPQTVAVEMVEGKIEDVPTLLPQKLSGLMAALGKANLAPSGPPMAYFKEVGEAEFKAEIMVVLAEKPQKTPPSIAFSQSPAGRALRILHKGSLAAIEDTYLELETFIEDRALDVSETTLERYLTNPATTADKDMVTEIYVFLK